MLLAESQSMPSDDLLSLDPVSSNPLEATLTELVAATRRVLVTVRLGGQPTARARAELRQARAMLESLSSFMEPPQSETVVVQARQALAVSDDGTWFETEAGRVDVARRGAVRRILVALAKARLDSPTKALTVDMLFEIGWPGERIPYESQVRRVYTAIWTLRTLGLDGLLLTRDEGYLLDPKRDVRVAA
ncbi:MAG: hypothetical protein U0271_17410 [Polyangiaceae bacterium]